MAGGRFVSRKYHEQFPVRGICLKAHRYFPERDAWWVGHSGSRVRVEPGNHGNRHATSSAMPKLPWAVR